MTTEGTPTEETGDPPAPVAETERLIGTLLVVGLIAALLAFAVLSWLAREMLAGETADFDAWLRSAVNGMATPGRTEAMRFASKFGGPTGLGVIGGVVLLGFLVKRWYRGAILLLVTLLGAGLLDTLLKLAFQRARPSPFFGQALPPSYSFPSGHALFGFVFFGTMAALLVMRVRSLPLRAAIWAVAAAAILMIGLSRIYLGVHYPSDVLAGYLTAIVWVVVVAAGDRLASRGAFRRRRAPVRR